MEAQGYTIAQNIFFQDNQSAMRIERNRLASCGQKSKHINIRYFFIKDQLEGNSIELHYCPILTEKMLADFLSKPLQGTLFRKFRDILMGHVGVDALEIDTITTPTCKEGVGENANVKENTNRKWINWRRRFITVRKLTQRFY